MKVKTIPTLSKDKPFKKSLTGSIQKKKFSKPTAGVLKSIVKIIDDFEEVKFGKNPTGISCSKEFAKNTNAKLLKEKVKLIKPAKKTKSKPLKEINELDKPTKKKKSKPLKEINELDKPTKKTNSKPLKEINERAKPTKKTNNKALKEINESKYKVPKNLVKIKKSKKPVVSPKQEINPSLTSVQGDDEQSGDKPKLDITKVEAAVKALFTLVKEGPASTKIELWDEATPIHLVITGVKFGTGPKRVIRISLPNSLITDTTDICLIVPDLIRGRNVDHEKTYHHYKDLLAQNDIKNIKTILPARQIRVEFNEYEARRNLCHSHDIFLIDQKISGFMVKKLGKEFFIKRKLPIVVKLSKKYLKSEIESKLHKTSFFLDNRGNTKTVQVGHMKQTPKQVAENILATFDNLSYNYPGGLKNIRVLLIKSPTSESLPIYFSMISRNDVKAPHVISKFKNTNVEGELFGKRVLVKSNGDVKLLSGSEEESDYDADFDFKKKKIKKSDDENDEEAEQSDSSLNQDNEEISNTKKFSESFKAGTESDDGDDGDDDDDDDDDDAEAEYLMEFAQTKKLQKKKKTNKKEGSESEKPDSESDDNANIKLEPTPKLQPKEKKLNRKRQRKAIDNVKSEENVKITKSVKGKNKTVIKKKKFNK